MTSLPSISYAAWTAEVPAERAPTCRIPQRNWVSHWDARGSAGVSIQRLNKGKQNEAARLQISWVTPIWVTHSGADHQVSQEAIFC